MRIVEKDAILFLILLVVGQYVLVQTQYRFENALNDECLTNHTLRQFSVERIALCFFGCARDCLCLAFQLTNHTVCELLLTTRHVAPSSLKTTPGCSYYDVFTFETPQGTECPIQMNTCTMEDCKDAKPLGVESGEIPDYQITASSVWDGNYGSSNGRLNFKASGGKIGAWSPNKLDTEQWIQYDFTYQAIVIKILSQGRQELYDQWVKSFTVSYSNDGKKFKSYLQGLDPKVFNANSDMNTVVTQHLSPVIIARFVRIHPKSWHGFIAIRAGFRGCSLSPDMPSCSDLKLKFPDLDSGRYRVSPGGAPIEIHCDMTSKNGIGVTQIGHDSEQRTLVDGFEAAGSYSRKIFYEADSVGTAALAKISQHCEQFIKWECYSSVLLSGYSWWVSRQGANMTYWGGATGHDGKCACGVTGSCDGGGNCNCNLDDSVSREDKGYLTDKDTLPVSELRFGDTGSPGDGEFGYHSLGKLSCWG